LKIPLEFNAESCVVNLQPEDHTAGLFSGESLVENYFICTEKPAEIPNPFCTPTVNYVYLFAFWTVHFLEVNKNPKNALILQYSDTRHSPTCFGT
jgi:hypothetical protein